MQLDNVSDFYPLAPVQRGILFHANAGSPTTYVGQLAFTLSGGIDEQGIEAAWRTLVERHAVLRSFFVWEGVDEPVQVVRKHVDLPVERLDWRHLGEQETEAFERFLEADLKNPLDLRKAPVMRVTLIRVGEAKYRVVWTHHHILMDGWSVPLLLNEFFSLCGGGVEAAVDLPDRRPYRDYIAWLAKQDSQRAKEHWSNLLSGFHSPVSVCENAPRSTDAAATGWEHQLWIEDDLLERVRQFSRRHRVTINTILQAAWAILLSRYADQRDIVFGATVSGRPPDLEGAQDMVGLFINTLPVRVQLQETEPVADLLKRIQEQQVQTRQFEYSRLVDVQQCSDVPGGSALFDSILVFENYPGNALGRLPGRVTEVGDWRFHSQTNYGFTLIAAVTSKMVLRCLHDPERIAPGTAKTVLSHVRQVIESMVAREGLLTGEIEGLTGEERQAAIDGWNDAALRPHEGERTILEQLAVQVRDRAEHIAVVDEMESLTYRELDLRSNRMARHLRGKGVRPESVVAVGLERGAGFIVTILGVLKAGGAWLPLDVTQPLDRLEAILKDSGTAVVVTTKAHSQKFLPVVASVVELDVEGKDIDSQPDDAVDAGISGRSLAYLIYTSGSTGLPKGVMVEHRSVVNLVHGQVETFFITPESRTLQFASTTFDASVSEIFCALLSGSQLHLASQSRLHDMDELLGLLRTREISLVTLSPSLLAVMQDSDLQSLTTLVTAGEACPAGVAARWSKGRRFINAYGPTETTVCATVTEPLDGSEAIHIGTALANTRIYILDSGLRPVAPGVIGELYVGGAPLARGYANNPAQTAERFVPDPFARAPGARMYRTGDRARYLARGRIEYLGRADSQIKLRGFRIELGEIEAVLERNPAVARACVVAREVGTSERRLVAYVTPKAGLQADTTEIMAGLRAKLPEYAVPSALVVLDAFQLNRSGKIDRAALPAPEERLGAQNELVAPRNDVERRIADIWREVLHLESVGIHDNFFELGGHSLSLFQVHGKLKKAFPKPLPLVQMFSYPTVALLAEYFAATATPTGKGNGTRSDAFSAIHARANKARQALKLTEGTVQ